MSKPVELNKEGSVDREAESFTAGVSSLAGRTTSSLGLMKKQNKHSGLLQSPGAFTTR